MTDPAAIRRKYAAAAVQNAVVRGLEEHGDDFELSVCTAPDGRGAGAISIPALKSSPIGTSAPMSTEMKLSSTTNAESGVTKRIQKPRNLQKVQSQIPRLKTPCKEGVVQVPVPVHDPCDEGRDFCCLQQQ